MTAFIGLPNTKPSCLQSSSIFWLIFSICTQSVFQLCLIFAGLLGVQMFFLESESHLKAFWLLGRLQKALPCKFLVLRSKCVLATLSYVLHPFSFCTSLIKPVCKRLVFKGLLIFNYKDKLLCVLSCFLKAIHSSSSCLFAFVDWFPLPPLLISLADLVVS